MTHPGHRLQRRDRWMDKIQHREFRHIQGRIEQQVDSPAANFLERLARAAGVEYLQLQPKRIGNGFQQVGTGSYQSLGILGIAPEKGRIAGCAGGDHPIALANRERSQRRGQQQRQASELQRVNAAHGMSLWSVKVQILTGR